MAKGLRAVGEDERPADDWKTMSIQEAVLTGDVLLMLRVQRRETADSFAKAGDNTRPQLNNELNKLHGLIAAEEALRALAAEEERRGEGSGSRRTFKATAI
ncbi:hypothetical protein AB0230_01880 [Microbacterium sp. NPDC089190]|uniref:hypothetical protein n=1 Tax=Microbacterium sp. NPDC089190 TaxID=3155063 RepID=UPI00344B0D9C